MRSRKGRKRERERETQGELFDELIVCDKQSRSVLVFFLLFFSFGAILGDEIPLEREKPSAGRCFCCSFTVKTVNFNASRFAVLSPSALPARRSRATAEKKITSGNQMSIAALFREALGCRVIFRNRKRTANTASRKNKRREPSAANTHADHCTR